MVSTDSNGLYYMRQRYYSPQLKRFLNQDIVTGDPKESQSLNRYCYVQGNPVSLTDPFGLSPLENPEKWLPFIHTILDVIGCIPGPVGMAANLINGILYFLVDHDPLMGGLSMLAVVTAGASKLAVGVGKAAKTAQIIESFGNIVSNAASFLINSKMLVDTALSMKDKYNENGQVLDSSFVGDAAQLALSALGMIMSGKGALGSGKNLKKGLERDDWWNTNGKSGSNPKNVFPENPDDLLPEIPRNKATKANGTTSQTIQTSDNIRIRAEQHPLLPGETYNPRHHGVHYHVEYKVDPTKSWNNKNNVKKWYPEGYTPGAGSGFIPGEPFPE